MFLESVIETGRRQACKGEINNATALSMIRSESDNMPKDTKGGKDKLKEVLPLLLNL